MAAGPRQLRQRPAPGTMTYNREDTMKTKYGDLPTGALFRFADGINDPAPIYRKVQDRLAAYDREDGRGAVLSMCPGDDVEQVGS